jgi:hypothetical protein
MLTNFPGGVSSFGIPQIGSGVVPPSNGDYYFVDGTNGADGSDGLSMESAKKTIAAANTLVTTKAKSNAVIVLLPGTYTEAVTISVANTRIIGMASSVKSVVWTSATDTTSCAITAANVEITGIYFKPPVYTSSATCASISLSNAPYANIHNNRFQGQTGSYNAIYSASDTSDNVTIANNMFAYMNTATYGTAINCVETLGFAYSSWIVTGNYFTSCVKSLVLPSRVSLIANNYFQATGITAAGAEGVVTTTGIILSGTSTMANAVHGNYFGGTYSAAAGYTTSASGDDWSGNFNIAGITTANPS